MEQNRKKIIEQKIFQGTVDEFGHDNGNSHFTPAFEFDVNSEVVVPDYNTKRHNRKEIPCPETLIADTNITDTKS